MIQDNKKVKYRYSDTKGFSHLYVTTAGYYEEGFAGLALFMEDLRKRKDIHKKIKDELMDNDWSRGIVYYPVYSVYTIGTYTRKYTSHHSDGIYDGHTKIGSVNYSVDNVTSRSGVKKSSKKMKSRFDELALDPCRVLHLEEILKKRVIGQDNAIELVSNAILRQRAGINDASRPIGSFLFMGPTGVGKTEVARALADALFDSSSHVIRLDMAEYQEFTCNSFRYG